MNNYIKKAPNLNRNIEEHDTDKEVVKYYYNNNHLNKGCLPAKNSVQLQATTVQANNNNVNTTKSPLSDKKNDINVCKYCHNTNVNQVTIFSVLKFLIITIAYFVYSIYTILLYCILITQGTSVVKCCLFGFVVLGLIYFFQRIVNSNSCKLSSNDDNHTNVLKNYIYSLIDFLKTKISRYKNQSDQKAFDTSEHNTNIKTEKSAKYFKKKKYYQNDMKHKKKDSNPRIYFKQR